MLHNKHSIVLISNDSDYESLLDDDDDDDDVNETKQTNCRCCCSSFHCCDCCEKETDPIVFILLGNAIFISSIIVCGIFCII